MKKVEKKIHTTVLFQGKDGAIEFSSDTANETIWANLNQISQLFETDKSGVSRHIKNIYKEKELDIYRTVAKFATVQKEGKRDIERDVDFYNLDMIISIGYRVNSKKATEFRQWATRVIKSYSENGYVINSHKISENYEKFIQAVDDIKLLLPSEKFGDVQSIIELVKDFAGTWLSLDGYDRDELEIKKPTKKFVGMTTDELLAGIAELKKTLMKKGEASELFAIDRNKESMQGIVGNVMQSFGGKPVYISVEEKAAHLLYFIIKNHPFIDGNKRSAAFAFIFYLYKNRRLDKKKITPEALTAITLLIAESDPKQKEKMVKLVQLLISKK